MNEPKETHMDVQAREIAELVDDAAVARYHRDGFLHVPGLLDDTEVAAFLADARRMLSREEATHWGDGDDTILDFVEHSQTKSDGQRTLALHPRICAVARRLAGRPMRLFKMELLDKRAGRSLPTEAHFDEFAFPFAGAPVSLTAWIALVDVPAERGCLTFVPGSHLLPPPRRESDAWEGYRRPEVVWMPRVTVPVRAGDCTFHHARVVHSAGGNATAEPRISATAVYMDAEAVYRPTGNDHIDDLGGAAADLIAGRPMAGPRFPLIG
jgi:phytanoyl-CoA hydroxylase